MSCKTAKADIMQYADAEMAPERIAPFETHLRSCGECTVWVAEAMQLKRSLRVAGMRYEAPAELRARVRSKIAPKSRRLGWVQALAVAALVLIAGAVAVRVASSRAASQQLLAEVVDRHVTALASANLVDVISTDRHTVKPWFQGKLPFTFNLPEVSGTPYILQGGRLAFLNQSAGAQLIYDLRKHQLSVFIFQEKDVPVLMRSGARSTFTVETWSQSGLRYFVVGDVSAGDLSGLADLLKKAVGM